MYNPMTRFWLLAALLLMVLATTIPVEGSKQLAFPGAEGFGKYAKGGRGGDVYHVTNLNDDGPGSLRFGIDTADNPRTIVFDIAGTIRLVTPIRMENKSHLTIAGQTAPGKGITIRDRVVVIKECSDIVVRYLRLRLGDKNPTGSEDVMTVDYCDQVILDHLSLTWGVDGNSDYRGNSNMTLQWLLYAEALHDSVHHKGGHAMCTSLRDCHGNTTLYHNIYSTSRSRHPTIGGGSGKKGYAHVLVDFRNCVNYNWEGPTNFGGMKLNVVNNYYKPGPCSDPQDQAMQMKDGDTTKARGFMTGNYFEGMPKRFNQDNFSAVLYTNTGNYMSTTRQQWASKEAFELGDFEPYTQTADKAYRACLRYTGSSLVRDRVDERLIENIATGKGKIIDSQDDVGGWDSYPEVRRPDDWDTDRDGIPTAWENSHGLNPKDPADRNADKNSDGYTNLEEYLNSLVPNMIEVMSKRR